MAMCQPGFSVLRGGGGGVCQTSKNSLLAGFPDERALFPLPESHEYKLETESDLEVQSTGHSLSCPGLITGQQSILGTKGPLSKRSCNSLGLPQAPGFCPRHPFMLGMGQDNQPTAGPKSLLVFYSP